MSDLQNQTPANTYKGLLQVGDYTNGVDSTAKFVSDGEGTPSALSVSTTKVGVGTASPSQELDVNGNVVATTLTTSGAVTAGSVSTSGAVGAGEYALDQTGSSSSAVAIHAPTTNELAIRTNSTEAMRIDSSGNCGIGTTTPDAFTAFFGNASNLSIGGAKAGEIELGFDAQAYNNYVTGLGGLAFLNLSNSSSGLNANSIFSAGIYGQTVSDTEDSNPNENAGGRLRFYTKPIDGTPVESMRIDDEGNVGIGTDSPSAPLEVSSTTGGVIMPRMNTTQRTAISSPTPGEMVYDTDLNKFYGYTNTGWVALH